MKAFLFDLNGTMIHDMDYHTSAWQHILNTELGGNFSWEEVKPQMYGKNQEVLERVFGTERFTADEIAQLSQAKEQRYQEEFRPHLRLLPGLAEFLATAHARGIALAIGSAAIPIITAPPRSATKPAFLQVCAVSTKTLLHIARLKFCIPLCTQMSLHRSSSISRDNSRAAWPRS